MSNAGAAGASTGAAAGIAAYVANIQKMVGPIAYVERDDFVHVLELAGDAVCVEARSAGILQPKHSYLVHAFGLTWYCRTKTPIAPPPGIGVIQAKKISVPY